ncbi:lisH domain-containing protein C1711.05-like isoform X2 [Branchiostoma floridae]|uniref:LisH domain-containing protein C1711.05-like isoform X2 n=1 Tax=Branchiostoma floridae TaxID=7739 RepID=A0A9J7LTS2_BRAFL|nr:lisH domain-containing protein C1711.05-like isoform X2 [Branchiostoma floridae]
MKVLYLLCLVLTAAVVQGYPVWKRDEGISETQAVGLEENLLNAIVKKKNEETSEKRDAFMADLQKVHDFEKQFSRDGQLHERGLKMANELREFLKYGKAWEAKKKGLKAQEYRSNENEVGKRSAFMDDLLDSLQFEKQFSKKGELSPNEMKTAKAIREYLEFDKAWAEKKGNPFSSFFGDDDSSSSEEDSSSSSSEEEEEKKDDSSSSDDDDSSSSSDDALDKKQEDSFSSSDDDDSSSSSDEDLDKKQEDDSSSDDDDSSSSSEDDSSSSSDDDLDKKQEDSSSSSDDDDSSSSSDEDLDKKQEDDSSSDDDDSSSSDDDDSSSSSDDDLDKKQEDSSSSSDDDDSSSSSDEDLDKKQEDDSSSDEDDSSSSSDDDSSSSSDDDLDKKQEDSSSSSDDDDSSSSDDDDSSSSSDEDLDIKRDSFMADLQKVHDFEQQFSRDGQLHERGLKMANELREFLNFGKAWEAKKKGLKAQEYRSNENEVGKRNAFMDDLLDSLQFEKQFSKKRRVVSQ